jgi:hypothetical protein
MIKKGEYLINDFDEIFLLKKLMEFLMLEEINNIYVLFLLK